MHSVETKSLRIPALGLGTFELEGDAGYRTMCEAIAIGYRHFDTAERYGNEREVGRAISASGIHRNSFFVTTKIWPTHFSRDDFERRVALSVETLGLVPDLLLLHFPPPEAQLPEVLENLCRESERYAFQIGVSNFTGRLMELAGRISTIPLRVNQVEYHPLVDRRADLDVCRAAGAALIAYSPLAQGRVFSMPALRRIAETKGKGAGQVALRWLVQQQGVAAIPRSSSVEHARRNFEIFDFCLSSEEMAEISSLAEHRALPNDPPLRAPNWIAD